MKEGPGVQDNNAARQGLNCLLPLPERRHRSGRLHDGLTRCHDQDFFPVEG